MAVQDSYSANIRAAVPGMIANEEGKTLISRNVETVAGIGFGLPVAQGASDGGCVATSAGTTKILGITVRDRSVRPETPNVFAQYDSARVMTKGVVWVVASVAVAAGDAVTVVVATGAFSNTGGVAIANARYDTSAAAGALAKVRLG